MPAHRAQESVRVPAENLAAVAGRQGLPDPDLRARADEEDLILHVDADAGSKARLKVDRPGVDRILYEPDRPVGERTVHPARVVARDGVTENPLLELPEQDLEVAL